ncbi:MAG: galactose mutarotase [Bacteroidales bacterium]|nr:galactose mutarotase [Bacteroidales bacterium]
MKKVLSIFAIALLLVSCSHKKEVKLIPAENFNTEVDGKKVSLYTLHNGFLTMQVTNYGGRVVALWMPDNRDSYEDIVLGYDHIDKYLNNSGERYLGAVVGRCANRISNASFTLNGVEYQLPKNDGENTLHGGLIGADKHVWDVTSVNDSLIQMHTVFADGEDGFPGDLDVTMSYMLTHDNQFQIRYAATTDKATLCNFSHHSFFNLKGEGRGTILDHELQINSRYMTTINDKLVPDGKYSGVKNTPFDFREKHAIGDNIAADDEQLRNAKGYDHNWIIDKNDPKSYTWDATLFDPASGREMQVWSDQVGMQFYSGNFFNGKEKGKCGKPLNFREGLALETQYFPDAINHESLSPMPILRPGEEYHQLCIYKFAVRPKEKK